MERELTEQELINVSAGLPISAVHELNRAEVELTEDELEHFLGGAPKQKALEEVIKHPGIYGKDTVDKAIEELEMMNSPIEETQSNGFHM